MALKVLQANLDRDWAAQDIVIPTFREEDLDLVIRSEPNKKFVRNGFWVVERRYVR